MDEVYATYLFLHLFIKVLSATQHPSMYSPHQNLPNLYNARKHHINQCSEAPARIYTYILIYLYMLCIYVMYLCYVFMYLCIYILGVDNTEWRDHKASTWQWWGDTTQPQQGKLITTLNYSISIISSFPHDSPPPKLFMFLYQGTCWRRSGERQHRPGRRAFLHFAD